MMPRLFLCLSLFVASELAAQDSPRPHFVRASGEAIISAKPDRAEITIAVSSRAPTAGAASTQNATESGRVLTSIKQALGSGGQVKTSGYSLAPQYEYSTGHAPRLTGYEASNSVIVTIDELSLVSKVIDTATAAGANNVNGVSFTLRDSSAVREQALTQAAMRARANAEALAKALQVQVVGLLEAEPTEAPVLRPLAKTLAAAPAMALQATPIKAGDLDIRATVTVTLQVR